MDLHCRFCGEPIDADELHDMPGVTSGLSGWSQEMYAGLYSEAVRQWREFGCNAFSDRPRGFKLVPCSRHSLKTDLAIVTAVYEVLGDDMDAAAAAFEDFL